MKTIKKISLMLLVCVFSTAVFAQKKDYVITVNVKGVPDEVIFYLIKTKKSGGADTLQRIKSKNEQLAFKGKSLLNGETHFVKMDVSIVKLSKDRKTWCSFFMDSPNIKIQSELSKWPDVTVKGSKTIEEDQAIRAVTDKIIDDYNVKILEVKNDNVKVDQLKREVAAKMITVFKAYRTSYATASIATLHSLFTVSEKETIYQFLDNQVKNSFYGKKLKENIADLKMQEKVAVGKVIPEFFITDELGKRRSIIDLAKQSKYTLIDFWAYWCKPCRAAIPNIKTVYSTYKDKGFNVVAVSTDPNVVAWKKALKEENTPWINGLQEGDASKAIFAIQAIPGYILVNHNAEIIIMDIVSPIKSKSIGSMNGAAMFVSDGQSLHGEGLNKVIEGLLGENKGK